MYGTSKPFSYVIEYADSGTLEDFINIHEHVQGQVKLKELRDDFNTERFIRLSSIVREGESRLTSFRAKIWHYNKLLVEISVCSLNQMFPGKYMIFAGKFVQRDSSPFPMISSELANGLIYIHGKHLAHIDLKPDNVLLTTAKRQDHLVTVKLADFGLSKRTDAGSTVNSHGNLASCGKR